MIEQIDAGQQLVANLTRQGFDVTAACWVKPSEADEWQLIIASKVVEERGLRDAYLTVQPILTAMPGNWIRLSDVRLVGAQAPLAEEILTFHRRFPRRSPTWTRGPQLGRMAIERAYIYPPATAEMTRAEVVQRVASFINRSGQIPPAILTLRDGSTVRGAPLSVQADSATGKVWIAVHDLLSSGTQTVDADQVVNVQ